MTAYYNEIDPYAAQWLRNLIDARHIARGDVDERSIADVRADDLRSYGQCHFFAGIGGWSVALRLAGWDDDRPVWTGSCPCQPFSAAGAGKAADDGRHLWPAWFPLIAECGPPIVFGEQVEAAIGWGWLDAVFADLEGQGYACGAAVLPACGVGAPHIRNRLWFVADAGSCGVRRRHEHGFDVGPSPEISGEIRQQWLRPDVGADLANGGMADATGGRREPFKGVAGLSGTEAAGFSIPELGSLRDDGSMAHAERDGGRSDQPQRRSQGRVADGRDHPWSGELGDANSPGLSERERNGFIQRETMGPQPRQALERGSPLNGFWHDAEWIACTDGKARPVEPGSFPLGHGILRRTSKLRAYGNAIVPQVAAEFIIAAAAATEQLTAYQRPEGS